MAKKQDKQDTVKKRVAEDKKIFLKAMEETRGLIAMACRKTNISRATYYRWREEDKEFSANADEVSEITGDFVESSLLKDIKGGTTAAIIFYCKTKLKNRGYVEKIVNDKDKEDGDEVHLDSVRQSLLRGVVQDSPGR